MPRFAFIVSYETIDAPRISSKYSEKHEWNEFFWFCKTLAEKSFSARVWRTFSHNISYYAVRLEHFLQNTLGPKGFAGRFAPRPVFRSAKHSDKFKSFLWHLNENGTPTWGFRSHWRTRKDLNLRPHAPEACALSNWATGTYLVLTAHLSCLSSFRNRSSISVPLDLLPFSKKLKAPFIVRRTQSLSFPTELRVHI